MLNKDLCGTNQTTWSSSLQLLFNTKQLFDIIVEYYSYSDEISLLYFFGVVCKDMEINNYLNIDSYHTKF